MVTVEGTLLTVDGQSDPEATVTFMLCGYGSQAPKARGTGGPDTGSLSEVSVTTAPLVSPATQFTIQLQGNDVIYPPGTYYTATIRNANGDVLQCNAYRFMDGTTYDLDYTNPIDPDAPPPPLPITLVDQLIEVPFSSNPVFDGSELTAWRIILSGDVTAATLSGCVPGNLYTFMVYQDATGGHTFTWPGDVYNGAAVNPAASSLTVQTFIADPSGSLYAAAGATYFP